MGVPPATGCCAVGWAALSRVLGDRARGDRRPPRMTVLVELITVSEAVEDPSPAQMGMCGRGETRTLGAAPAGARRRGCPDEAGAASH